MFKRNQSQQRDTSIDFTTPAETRRYGKETFGSVVVWPTAQAFVVGACSVAAFLSILVAPAIVGPRSFWLGAFIVGVSSLIYAIWNETDWRTMLAWPLLAGGLFWCLWAFSDGLFHIRWRPWHSLAGAGLVAFNLVMVFWIWVSLGQRLIQQSLHQERYGWDALARVFEWRVKQPAPPRRDMPIMYSHVEPEATELTEHVPPPEAELTRLELFLLHTQDCGTLSRDPLCAALMRDGSQLGQTEWSNCRDYLARQKYVTVNGNATRWARGASAEVALAGIR